MLWEAIDVANEGYTSLVEERLRDLLQVLSMLDICWITISPNGNCSPGIAVSGRLENNTKFSFQRTLVNICKSVQSLISWSLVNQEEQKIWVKRDHDFKKVYTTSRGYLSDHLQSIPLITTSSHYLRSLPLVTTSSALRISKNLSIF